MIDITALPPTLAKKELEEVTSSRTREKMRKRLDEMGVPYRCYANGWPVVSRIAFEQAMGVAVKSLKSRLRLVLG